MKRYLYYPDFLRKTSLAQCAYRWKKIREIEEKWIDENVKDEGERRRRKENLHYILILGVGVKADCRLKAVDGSEFCMFHDPEYWRKNADEVREEFLKRLKNGESFFIGFHLPEIKFPEVVEGDLYMDLAKIHGDLHAYTKFQGEASFYGATFQGEASFYGATFQGKAWFDRATFQGKAWFDRATFQREASFDGAKFQRARFYGAKFQGEAWFDRATFQEARFDGATFQRARFDRAKFQRARFDGAKFQRARFYGAKFQRARFDRATFQRAWFYGATFQRARFDGATFQRARFDGAKFQGEAWFYGAKFQRARFDGATFQRARFDRATFFGKANFTNSTFLGHVTFEDSVFLPDLLGKCSDPESYISFRRVSFKNGSQIVFDGCNMRRVSFIHTDVSRVKFNNVDWGEDFRIYDEKLLSLKDEKERKAFIRECKKKLETIRDVLEGKKKDEEIEKEIELKGERDLEVLKAEINKKINSLENEEEKLKELKNLLRWDYDLTLDNVLAVYRSLRDNHDYYLKYEDSGRFFINEMRLKRRFIGKASSGDVSKYPPNIRTSPSRGFWKKLSSIVEKLVMLLYETVSLYGESYTRPIGFIIACISMFSVLRFLVNNSYVLQTGFCWGSLQPLLEEFKNSTYAFFQLYWDEKPLTFIERILSPPILGILYISLRRKLERKIRH